MNRHLKIPNDTKIRFCNTMHAMQLHFADCNDCLYYICRGDGDLCDMGKDLIARELAYAETAPVL